MTVITKKDLDNAAAALASGQSELIQLREKVEALEAGRAKLRATLRLLCSDLIALSTESSGVAGWHKNGQIASWDTFEGMMKIARDYHDNQELDRVGRNYMAEGIRMVFDEDLITRYYDDEFDAEFVLLPDVEALGNRILEGN